MKTDMIQQTQRILNLIAKRDLDDDGRTSLKVNPGFDRRSRVSREEAIDR